jgi:hypothetical protein
MGCARTRKSKGKRQKSKGKNLCARPWAGLGGDLRGLAILERRGKLATTRNLCGAQRSGALVAQWAF